MDPTSVIYYAISRSFNFLFGKEKGGLKEILAERKKNNSEWANKVATLKVAIRANPSDVMGHCHLGQTYFQWNKIEKARESFKEAIRVDPDNDIGHFFLGVTYFAKMDWEKSIELFKETIRIRPDHAKCHHMLGTAYFRSGNRSDALSEYKILMPLDKDLANELFDLIYKD